MYRARVVYTARKNAVATFGKDMQSFFLKGQLSVKIHFIMLEGEYIIKRGNYFRLKGSLKTQHILFG